MIASTQRERRAVEIARQPGAEQGVDDEVGGVEIDRLGGRDRPAQRAAASAASPRSAARSPSRPSSTAIAARAQQPRGDEAVAAVAARPAERRRRGRALGAMRAASSATAAPARSISAMPGVAAGDGQPVGLAHLGRGQQFGTAAGIEHGAIVAPRPRRGKARPTGRRENWRFPSRDFLLYRAPRSGLIPDSSAGRAFDC